MSFDTLTAQEDSVRRLNRLVNGFAPTLTRRDSRIIDCGYNVQLGFGLPLVNFYIASLLPFGPGGNFCDFRINHCSTIGTSTTAEITPIQEARSILRVRKKIIRLPCWIRTVSDTYVLMQKAFLQQLYALVDFPAELQR